MATSRKDVKRKAAAEDADPPQKLVRTDDDNIVACEISKTRKVIVKKWQGRVLVDIREFYNKDGKTLPGKKGISLTLDQWKTLQEHIEEVDAVIADFGNS